MKIKKVLVILLISLVFMIGFSFSATAFNVTGYELPYSPDSPLDVDAVDLDDDGDIDIVTVENHDDELVWYENDGSESFTEHIINSNTTGINEVFVIDLDDDNDIDMLVTNDAGSDGAVYWFENDGSESFTKHVVSSEDSDHRTSAVFGIDFDQDGDKDIIIGTLIGDDILWYENDGSESFTEYDIGNGNQVNDIYPADIDDDGDLDVAFVYQTGGGVGWLENNGSMGFSQHTLYSNYTACRKVKVIDLDDDGDEDIIFSTTVQDNFFFLENDGSENFAVNTISSIINDAWGFDVYDYDSDGDLDVIGGTNSYLNFMENDGSESFTTSVLREGSGDNISNVRTVYNADINDDGKMDFVIASAGIDKVIWWETGTNAYVCNTTYFSDNFEYSYNFSDCIWQVGSCMYTGELPRWDFLDCEGYPSSVPCYPTDSGGVFSGTSFAQNQSNTGGYSRTLGEVFEQNYTSGQFMWQFNYSDISSPATQNGWELYVGEHETNIFGSWNAVNSLRINFGASSEIATFFHGDQSWTGDVCTIPSYSRPESGLFELVIDIDNGLYSIYIDNIGYCIDSSINMTYIGATKIYEQNSASGFYEKYLDDVTYCEAISIAESVNGSDVNCTDSDGVDYFIRGNVTDDNATYEDYCLHDELGNYSNQEVIEYYCTATGIDAYIKDCKDFGSTYNCYQGVCVNDNQRPTLNEARTYFEYDGAWVESDYIRTVDNVSIRVNATDNEGDDIYQAVQCNSSTATGVWREVSYPFAPTLTPTKCTYSSLGNHTAIIYLIDPDIHGWVDYTSAYNVTVNVVECRSGSQCDSGYDCVNQECVILNATSCNETDGGYNLNVTGTLYTNVFTEGKTDFCQSYRGVQEYYCDNSSPDYYYTTVVNCPDWQYCLDGHCENITGLLGVTFSVRDASTSSYLDGISYTITDLNTSTEYTGTIDSYSSLTVYQGHYYDIELEDSSGNYKSYTVYANLFDDTSYTAYMEKHCSGTCLFYDDFDYYTNVLTRGWVSDYDRPVVSYSSLGRVMKINTSDSFDPLYAVFPDSSDEGVTAQWDIIMSDAEPADSQEVWVYLYHNDGSGSIQVLMQFKYIIDVTNRMYYWDTVEDEWSEVPLSTSFTATNPFTTKVEIDYSTAKFDLYVDRLSTGTFVKYVEDAPLFADNPLNMILIYPFPSVYDRTTYFDEISITEGEVSGLDNYTQGTLTNPAGSDLQSVWYRDGNGDLKFDRTQCEGWNSMILCAVLKTGINKATGVMAWMFSGTHIILVILVLLVLILLVPVIIEIIRHK